MAYPIELTIGTGNKVIVNYQSQEVSVSLTYRLERGDVDPLAVAREKAPEVVAVHRAAWESVRGAKDAEGTKAAKPESAPKPSSIVVSGLERVAHFGADSEAPAEAASEPEEMPAAVRAKDREPSTAGQLAALRALLCQSGAGEDAIKRATIARFGCKALDELSYSQACEWLLEIQRDERERVRTHRGGATEVANARLNGYQNAMQAS